MEWNIINTTGDAPGPCNMHSADLIGKLIYVFRGGDGKDYLNDLHIFNPGWNRKFFIFYEFNKTWKIGNA